MKFTIEKNVILNALTNVTKALSQKITIPVLNGIVLELSKKGLDLLASDSELTIKVNIASKEIKNIEKEGKLVIQSRYILDIIRKMPSDLITFEEVENNNIKIYTETNEFVLSCYNLNEYPTINLEKSKDQFTLKANILKKVIKQTAYAMSTQEVRPLLTGLNLKINGDLLECVATDSYRLAKKVLKLDSIIEKSVNIVIPGKSVNELSSILTGDDDVEINLFNNKILFAYDNIIFQTSLLSGAYPDTTNYIPKEFSYIVNTKLSELYDSIDRASIITLNKDKNIVKMSISNNQMVIYGNSLDNGTTKETINIECNNKSTLDVSFSSKYMMDALKVIDSDNILIQLNSDDKPIIINDVEDNSVVELILPIKTY